jgi:hypothetical protein
VLADLLQRHYNGAPNYTVRLVTSASTALTRGALRELLKDLFQNSRGAELLLFFAGHGSQTPWGAELVTPDYSPNSLGVSMNDILTLANNSPASEVTSSSTVALAAILQTSPDYKPSGYPKNSRPAAPSFVRA